MVQCTCIFIVWARQQVIKHGYQVIGSVEQEDEGKETENKLVSYIYPYTICCVYIYKLVKHVHVHAYNVCIRAHDVHVHVHMYEYTCISMTDVIDVFIHVVFHLQCI